MKHIRLGDYNTLTVVKTVDFGVYLDGYDDGEILLPTRYVPEGISEGDTIEVFIYLDQDAYFLQKRISLIFAMTLNTIASGTSSNWKVCGSSSDGERTWFLA